jgi:hypothetical protein
MAVLESLDFYTSDFPHDGDYTQPIRADVGGGIQSTEFTNWRATN